MGFGDGGVNVDGGTILFSQTTEADSSDSVVLLAEGGTFEVIEGCHDLSWCVEWRRFSDENRIGQADSLWVTIPTRGLQMSMLVN